MLPAAVLLLQLAHAALASAAVKEGLLYPVKLASEAPSFCHDLECPKYETKAIVGYNVELRSYEPALWVSTNLTGMDYDKATGTGFMRLFQYISGNNADRQKVEMTAPVRVKLIPGPGPTCESTFEVSFFVPFKFQESGPPAPKDSSVYISKEGPRAYYVLSYGGRTSQTKVLDRAQELVQMLQEAKEQYEFDYFFSAGYDSPFRLLNRHNEVWVPACTSK